MTIVITDKSTNFKEYNGFISKVSGLMFALMHGNSGVDSTLRVSGLTANSVLKGNLINPAGATLVEGGGLQLSSGNDSGVSPYLQVPFAITDYGNKGFTVLLAVNSSAKIQLFTFAGYRFSISTNGDLTVSSQADGTIAITQGINLINLGYSSATSGIKAALIGIAININSSGFSVTTTIHDSSGQVIKMGSNSFATASLVYGAYPYIGGAPVGTVGTVSRLALHYGSFFFNRPITDAEKTTAAKQLAQYANYLGAGIS